MARRAAGPREWRPFEEARKYVRSLGLLDQCEWFAYSRGDLARRFGARPRDIPGCPYAVYRDQGWRGMRDWLGPRVDQPVLPGQLPFLRARRFARSLRLETSDQWRRWIRGELPGAPLRPGNVPEFPADVYPRAWRGWDDWLGVVRKGTLRRCAFRPFDRARAFVRSLGLANVRAWREYLRGRRPDLPERPDDIPANPDAVYRSLGWSGYGDWLGTGTIGARERPMLPYAEARSVVRQLGLRKGEEFVAWMHGERADLPAPPRGMPVNVERVYRGCGWISWGDFLGTGFVVASRREYRSFCAAREFARSLGLSRNLDWRAWVRGDLAGLPARPADIPSSPDVHYLDCGWTNWGDFLGTGNEASGSRVWRSFRDTRAFTRSLRLCSVEEWRSWLRGDLLGRPPRPQDVPTNPDCVYAADGWNGWPDFLGHRGHVFRKMPFDEARDLARRTGIRTGKEWVEWIQRTRDDLPDPPENLPAAPHYAYRREGWQGWGHFLGTGRVGPGDRKWPPFAEARDFARSLGLGNRDGWDAARRAATREGTGARILDFPAKPHFTYSGRGWAGWPDFLGTPETGPRRRRRHSPAGSRPPVDGSSSR